MEEWPRFIQLTVFNDPEFIDLHTVIDSNYAVFVSGDQQKVLVHKDNEGVIRLKSILA